MHPVDEYRWQLHIGNVDCVSLGSWCHDDDDDDDDGGGGGGGGGGGK